MILTLRHSLISIVVFGFACTPIADNKLLDEPEEESCASGSQLMHFQIDRESIDSSTISIVGLEGQLTVRDDESAVRVDLCWDDEQGEVSSVQQLVIKNGTGPRTDLPQVIESTGLTEALFGEYAELRLIALNQSGVGGIFIGPIAGQESSFVGAATVVPNDSGYRLLDDSALVGTISPGNPFPDEDLCSGVQRPGQMETEIGSFTLSGSFCYFAGGGHTAGYTFRSVVIQSTEDPDQRFVFDGDHSTGPDHTSILNSSDENYSFTYKWNHHNGCDSFVLSSPLGNLAATTTPVGGCGTPLAGAPDRNNSSHRYGLMYTVDGGDVQRLTKSHYINMLSRDLEEPGDAELTLLASATVDDRSVGLYLKELDGNQQLCHVTEPEWTEVHPSLPTLRAAALAAPAFVETFTQQIRDSFNIGGDIAIGAFSIKEDFFFDTYVLQISWSGGNLNNAQTWLYPCSIDL